MSLEGSQSRTAINNICDRLCSEYKAYNSEVNAENAGGVVSSICCRHGDNVFVERKGRMLVENRVRLLLGVAFLKKDSGKRYDLR